MTNEQREIKRKKRVLEYAERHGNVKITCRRFGIARSTFYLWRERYRKSGDEGLARRGSVPHNHPTKTPEEIVEKILHLRRTYHMGPIRVLDEIGNTAHSRAVLDEDNCNPLTTEELAALDELGDLDLLLVVLIQLEAGVRFGKALELRWGQTWWGRDEADTSRHLSIEGSRPARSKGDSGRTKTGRKRRVAMSRRLRRVLLHVYMRRGRPAEDVRVVEREWRQPIRDGVARACKAAGIRALRQKDLRDTYASTLITHGITLKWVSLQLGHRSVAITERHFAAYMAQDRYRNPWQVQAGPPANRSLRTARWVAFRGAGHRGHHARNIAGIEDEYR